MPDEVTDQQNAVTPPFATQPEPRPFVPSEPKVEPKPEVKADTPKPNTPKTETKEDHLGIIAELANSLHNVSPSGAMTVRDKILERVAAIQDPKAYNEKIAAERKTEEEAEKVRKTEREKAKAASEKAKA